MGINGNHCSFVLLAEFHIFEGAQLKYQFPQPLGVDEGVLAMSMLPDGAETQLDDWTIFFLNQTPFNTISPVLALETPEVKAVPLPGEQDDSTKNKPDLLCVLNLVRTKHDKTLDRGAKVLALAICTRHPFIQIFKPFLLMALDDYFSDPSQDCLARLFDAVNAMDLSGAPLLTRHEKIVMRSSERKDIFSEKFVHLAHRDTQQNWNGSNPGLAPKSTTQHRSTNSGSSYSSFEEGLLSRHRERAQDEGRTREREPPHRRDRVESDSSTLVTSTYPPSTHQESREDASFSLGGSAVWVGDESGLDLAPKPGSDGSSVVSLVGSNTMVSSSRKRRSTDASSLSSQAHSKDHMPRAPGHTMPSYYDPHLRSGLVKDTHFYHTTVAYKDHQLPIKMPLSTFPEEVGDYSLITLIKEFSSHQLVSGPQHPHLHTNGPQTHPIIILFNALVTGKRIIFLGHKRPAGEVSSFVLSACALGSGCGVVLRGFIERAFPYANLNNRDEWESVPAYIAGVTNPIFEASRAWDLLLVIGAGTVTVAKDIHQTYPVTPTPSLGAPLITRSGTLKAESSIGSEEDGRTSTQGGRPADYSKAENNADKLFIEDLRSAIDDHFGESLVRMRFTEYVMRFVRLASRYEEEVTGSTKIGFPSSSFTEVPGRPPQLGSGIAFNDEATCFKELTANAQRIEAWRKTNSYQYCVADFAKFQANAAIRGFDVMHQIFRLRHARTMSDAEALLIMRTLADNVKTYEQVVELLAYLIPHGGGLLHLGFGLFHQKEAVREATVDLLNQLRAYPVGVLFLQSLNHFQRYAYVRQAHAREKRILSEQQQQQQQQQQQSAQPFPSRAHSNSIVGGGSNGAF
ncbi:putative docking domain of Afi1 for Arf3 in vesicle trafficking [Lyophyllum shimeji]|uniref:Docking domain of Afi1 for Arf3 in vesicle trafficking n=1 Tax=Lyophyllum shimeji TaxID=47721 RepID=A0A9P3PLM0_LYOSH|nr:putative docking domain of Afi1 for Arf3 in vesicle trafficking [Lyophyllum shimeji]